jgi:hypothetical protein
MQGPQGDTIRVVTEASARSDTDDLYTIPGTDHFTVCKAESANSSVVTKLTGFISNIISNAEAQTNREVRRLEELSPPGTSPSPRRNQHGGTNEGALGADLQARYQALKKY